MVFLAHEIDLTQRRAGIHKRKRHGRSIIRVVSDSPGHHNKQLFVGGFLVDYGSAVSVLPPTSKEKRSPCYVLSV